MYYTINLQRYGCLVLYEVNARQQDAKLIGWNGSMMAMPAGRGKAASNQISGLLNYCINTKNALFYWVNPSPLKWKYSGFRVGKGYYHE